MRKKERDVVLITGASSGLGNACATYLAKQGFSVFGTSRQGARYEQRADEFFKMLAMDVTDVASVQAAVDEVLVASGRIDCLVCNAGIGIAGSAEETSLADIRQQFETNFYGVVHAVRAVLAAMRAQKSGKIIIIGSLGGMIGMPFQAYYAASKAALEGFVESLRFELRPFGVQVCLLEPGHFQTALAQTRQVCPQTKVGPYKEMFNALFLQKEVRRKHARDPLEVAQKMEQLIEARHLAIRYLVGPRIERVAAGLKRFLPAGLFERILRKYYRLP